MQAATANSTANIKEFTTTVLRKIRKIEYKNVKHIPGYEKSEKEYLDLVRCLNGANTMIKDLMSYEHGNRFLKAIKNGMAAVSDKSTLNVYKSKDIYEEMSGLSRRMSMMDIEVEDKREAEKFSDAYKKLSESKKALNTKLEHIRQQLKQKRNQCIGIDKDRRKLKNMRYDLEVLLQDGGYNQEIREAEKKAFAEFSGQILKMVVQFVEDSSIGPVLKSVAKEYANHMKETVGILTLAE